MVALAAGAYFFVRLIIAAIRNQPKSAYLKKFVAAIVVVIVASIGVYHTRTPEQRVAHQAKVEAEQKANEKKNLSEEATVDENKSQKEARKREEEKQRRQRQAEFEATEKQRKQNEMIQEITTGWNLSTTDADNDKSNPQKAATLVKKYPDYIHNAEANWISAEDALRKPWEYYGKVVNLSGRIYSIEQLPPNSSDAQFFGGNCYHAMLAIGDGYDPVAVSMYIVGDSSQIAEDSIVNVKGYIFGHAKLVNRMGGGSRGLAFIGFQE